jgi:hypothetical protein
VPCDARARWGGGTFVTNATSSHLLAAPPPGGEPGCIALRLRNVESRAKTPYAITGVVSSCVASSCVRRPLASVGRSAVEFLLLSILSRRRARFAQPRQLQRQCRQPGTWRSPAEGRCDPCQRKCAAGGTGPEREQAKGRCHPLCCGPSPGGCGGVASLYAQRSGFPWLALHFTSKPTALSARHSEHGVWGAACSRLQVSTSIIILKGHTYDVRTRYAYAACTWSREVSQDTHATDEWVVSGNE